MTNSSDVLTLHCTQLAAHLELTPYSHNYGDVRIGGPAGSFVFTIRNFGNAASGTFSVSMSGPSNAYTVGTSTCGLQLSLAVGANCTMEVLFTPGSLGLKTASFQLNDENFASLTGTGIN